MVLIFSVVAFLLLILSPSPFHSAGACREAGLVNLGAGLISLTCFSLAIKQPLKTTLSLTPVPDDSRTSLVSVSSLPSRSPRSQVISFPRYLYVSQVSLQ